MQQSSSHLSSHQHTAPVGQPPSTKSQLHGSWPGSCYGCRSLGGRQENKRSESSLVLCQPLLEGAGLGVEFHGQLHTAVWLQGIETEHVGQLLCSREAKFLVLLWGDLQRELSKNRAESAGAFLLHHAGKLKRTALIYTGEGRSAAQQVYLVTFV